MRVELQLFAVARELVGSDRLIVDLDQPATVGALRVAIIEKAPSLRPLLPSMMVAVGTEYATDEVVIEPGAQVALIPPVSGGSQTQSRGKRSNPKPSFRVMNFTVQLDALEIVPELVARACQVLPLEIQGNSLTVAIAHGDEIAERIGRLRSVLRITNPILWAPADPEELMAAMDQAYRLAASEIVNCPPMIRGNCARFWLCLEPSIDSSLRACDI